MSRITSLAFVLPLAFAATTAVADTSKGPVPTLPKAGDPLGLTGAAEWPKLQWMYDAPSASDAAGKVIVHWFCSVKAKPCADDLARIITLRDAGKIYIVAYIDGSQRDAKKLDPIRESEGIGRGTVAFGPGVTKLMKQLGVGPGPSSIVVDVDGKVALVGPNAASDQLDARDAKANALAGAVKDFTTSQDGPKTVKIGDKFQLTFKVQLSPWLSYSKGAPMQFDWTAPKDIKCDAMSLKGDQLKIDDHTLTAMTSCTAPKGVYEARGQIRFSYSIPGSQNMGTGEDGATWKFEVK